MTSAVSVMSPEEQRQHSNPNRDRYVKATRWGRELSIQRAYLLKAELAAAHGLEQREAILLEWAESAGRDVKAMREELRWAESVAEEDIRAAFAAEGIPDEEWQARLGTGHIKEVSPARDLKTKRVLTSMEKAKILVEAFHGNWRVSRLKEVLQERGLKRKKPGMKIEPTKNLTACQLLKALAEELPKRGVDIDLGIIPANWRKPSTVNVILERIAFQFRQLYPDTTWAPKVESNPKEAATGAQAKD